MARRDGRDKTGMWHSGGCIGLAACCALLLDGSSLQASFLAQEASVSIFIAVSAATFSITCAALPFFAKHTGKRLSFLQFGPGLSAIALLAADILLDRPQTASLFFAYAGCAFGAGLACGSAFWIGRMSRLPRKQILGVTAAAMLFAACFKAVCLIVPEGIADQATVAMLLMACLARSPRTGSVAPPQNFANDEFTSLAQAIFKRNWALASACIPSLLIVAFTWSGNVQGLPLQNNPGTDSSWGMTVGMAGASVLLFVLCHKDSACALKRASGCAPMVCIAFAAVSWVAGNFAASGLQKVIVSSALGVGLACIVALLVVHLALEAHDNPHALAVSEIALPLCAFVFVAGYTAWPLLGDDAAGTISIVLCILQLMLPVFPLTRASLQESTDSSRDESTSRIQSLGDCYRLTKREREVLALLAEGRTATYIAQRQYVSVNTVRTHVKRIYVKMDVTSRQELLDIMHADSV